MIDEKDFIGWTGAILPDPPPADVVNVIDAVNAYVNDLPVVEDAGGKWDRKVTLGALMLAARLYSRRNTSNGIESLDMTDVSYVAQYDPDIPLLLRTKSYHKPVVG